ncbi:UDP-glucose 4-epimerase (EC 5.1.3.2), partial [Arthrobacter sp. DR-2P]
QECSAGTSAPARAPPSLKSSARLKRRWAGPSRTKSPAAAPATSPPSGPTQPPPSPTSAGPPPKRLTKCARTTGAGRRTTPRATPP